MPVAISNLAATAREQKFIPRSPVTLGDLIPDDASGLVDRSMARSAFDGAVGPLCLVHSV
jgi:hypothetical protein